MNNDIVLIALGLFNNASINYFCIVSYMYLKLISFLFTRIIQVYRFKNVLPIILLFF